MTRPGRVAYTGPGVRILMLAAGGWRQPGRPIRAIVLTSTGLVKVVVDPRLQRTTAVLVLAVSRDRDDQRVAASLPSKLSGHHVTVEGRQADVQQDHVGTVGAGRLDALGAVVGELNSMAQQPQ